LAALSHALDLVEGQPRGHAVRTSLIAMRIAETINLDPGLKESLFYAALLKDCGCSTNSARIHKIFGGDEFLAKRKVKYIDWTNPLISMRYAIGAIDSSAGIVEKLRRMAVMASSSPQATMDQATAARCTRGATIATQLGFDVHTAQAVQHLDEHWDGKGSPSHLEKDATPIVARILCVCQTLEIFVTSFGIEAGYEMLEERCGTWFDPDLVQATNSLKSDQLWEDHAHHVAGLPVTLPEPESALAKPLTDIDRVAEAFAEVIDAKSAFTGEHSSRVNGYAMELAGYFDFDADRKQVLSRAGLLHDIGKLGVPNSILDKPDRLTDTEFDRVKLHPKFTYEILGQIRGQERMTEIAANHHERLDGKGYWRGLGADQLDLDMRILAAADVFDALSAARPYREALPLTKVFAIMDEMAGNHLDPACVCGLKEIHAGEETLPMAA
jgi:HD-GYP domain-containing protein (c-di-GMP phosphodiesterase class II)